MFNLPLKHLSGLQRTRWQSILLVLTLTLSAFSMMRGQSVPIAFAGLLAGGGTVCSTSIPVYAITGTGVKYGDGCPATQATFNAPVGIAIDSYGNIFVADQTYDLVRVIYNGGSALASAIIAANVQTTGLTPQKGYIYTIVGGVTTTPASTGTYYCNEAGSGATALNRQLDGCPGVQTYVQPRGLAVDTDGNLFISNVGATSSLRVFYVGGSAAAKLISTETTSVTTPLPGYVYPIAGTSGAGFAGDSGLAIKASVNTPRGLFLDAAEDIFIADTQNSLIRRIDGSTGIITTVAGYTGASRCVTATCTTYPFAGDGTPATSSTVQLDYPYGVALDSNGNIFIADSGAASTSLAPLAPGRIRVVYAGGTLPGISSPVVGDIYTYAGSGTATPAQTTVFQGVYGVGLDPAGFLYVTDYRNGTTGAGANRIWRVDPGTGNIAAIAGNSGTATLTSGNHCNAGTTGPLVADKFGDGCPATQAYLNTPQENVVFDAYGNYYVDDRTNNIIRSFSYNNNFPVTAVGTSVTQPLAFLYAAGSLPITETFTTEGSASSDYSDSGGDTCALNTALPASTTCVDYVKFVPSAAGQRSGTVTVSSATAVVGVQTLSGLGGAPVLTINPPSAVALGTALQPLSVSIDQLGNVNISDGKGKQLVRTTIAGATPSVLLSGLGTPRQSATDSYGDVFVVDSTNNNVVERTAAGSTLTIVTGLSAPHGLVVDLLGNLYVADTGNNRLIFVTPVTGNQHTVPLSGFTLSAPTSLAMDSAGDLFIIDSGNTRLIEIPLNALPQLVTLPAGSQPLAIAFDPGGDAYIADKVTDNILFVPAGSTSATNLITGLTSPSGVAVGSSGNVFVADSSATSVSGYNFALDASTFTTTNIALTSLPITLTVGSVGSAVATLSTPPYVETGSAAFVASGAATCTAGLLLAIGSNCTQTFVFSPTTPGAQSAKVVFSDTASQTVTANFNATATNIILTTTTLTLVSTPPVNYGQTVTYTVTLTAASTGASAPTGTISFVVDGKTVAMQIVSSNPYTFSVSLAIGTHSIAATYSGDAIYAGGNGSTSITVNKAITTTTASYSQSANGTVLGAVVTPGSVGTVTFTGNVIFYVDGKVQATVPVGNGTVTITTLIPDGTHTYYAMYVGDANYATSTSTTQSLIVARTATSLTVTSTPVSSNGTGGLQLSAKLTATGAGTPTGTITFTNGVTTLGTLNLSAAVNGVVTLTTSTISYASYVFTATYSGDGLFQPSTVTITQGPDFAVIAPIAALAVPQGAQAIETITVTPINGYSGTLTASCSNLPVNAICRFLPTPLTLTSTASSTLSVQVFVGVNPTVASVKTPTHEGTSRILFALLLLAPLSFGLRRKLFKSGLNGLLSIGLIALLFLPCAGCGNKTPANSTTTFSTPTGTTAVTVTLTDTNNVSRSAIFNVVVSTQ